MEVLAYSNNIEDYLQATEVVNYTDEAIQKLSESLFEKADNLFGF